MEEKTIQEVRRDFSNKFISEIYKFSEQLSDDKNFSEIIKNQALILFQN